MWSYARSTRDSAARASDPAAPSNRPSPRPRSPVGGAASARLKPIRRFLAVGRSDDQAEGDADHLAAIVLAGERARESLWARPSASGPSFSPAPSIVNTVLTSSGHPLEADTLAYFEPRFGVDLSGIRLHDDDTAQESARLVNARAYAVGDDIVLGRGAPALRTQAGRQLLAHEIAHTVQEDPASASRVRRQAGDAGASFNDAVGRRAWGEAARLLAEMSEGNRRAALRALSTDARSELRRASLAVDPSPQNVVAAEIDQTEAEAAPAADHDIAEAGLLSLGQVLQSVAAPDAQALRDLYNIGKTAIEAERTRLLASGAAEAQIAERLATMRFELAMDVRRTGSALMRQGAELIDAVRGQARPTYASLRAAGKTNAEIIESAARTNEFVNRLPRNLRYLGKTLWFVSAGLSIYVIVTAPEGQRAAVAEREVETTVGGIGGAAAGEALCIVVGIATEGLGLIVCGLVGGIAGAEGARRGHLLQFLDIAPHDVPELAGTIFRVEGSWQEIDLFIISIPQRTVAPSENVLVVATGTVSGEEVGGRGHYRSYEVTPASDAAVRLFGSRHSRYVPQYLLVRPSAAELGRVQ